MVVFLQVLPGLMLCESVLLSSESIWVSWASLPLLTAVLAALELTNILRPTRKHPVHLLPTTPFFFRVLRFSLKMKLCNTGGLFYLQMEDGHCFWQPLQPLLLVPLLLPMGGLERSLSENWLPYHGSWGHLCRLFLWPWVCQYLLFNRGHQTFCEEWGW